MPDRFRIRVEEFRESIKRIGPRDVFRQVLLALIEIADRSYLCIVKQAPRSFRPRFYKTWRNFRSSTFSNCISLIVGIGAKKKMVRPNAGWDIAAVKYLQSLWNWTVVQFPRYAVRHECFVWALRCLDRAITELRFTGRDPKPTCFSFLDLWPESLFESFSHAQQLSSIAAVHVCGNFQNVHGGPLGNRSRI
jgi:hypothetical protein